MAPIKVGIVGYGFSTKCFHLPFILPNPDLEVYAFLQRAAPPSEGQNSPRWGHCTVDFPDSKHYRTSDEFFADPTIDLVVVCTHDHEEFVEKAIHTGKHVVVEKPFVTSSAKADEIIAAAKGKGKVIAVFHNRRFDSDFRTLEHLVNSGALGDIREAELHFDMAFPTWIASWTDKQYRPGEGMAFGLGSHMVDQAICLFGPPLSVTGFLRSNRGVDSEIDDTYTIILQYGGARKNLLVTIKTSIVTPLQDQFKYFVRGMDGSFVKYGTDPQEAAAVAAPGKPATDPNYGVEKERIWGTLSTKKEFDAKVQKYDEESELYVGKYPSFPGYYRGFYENVVDAIRGKAEVKITPEAARDGLRIIELARESSEKGVTLAF